MSQNKEAAASPKQKMPNKSNLGQPEAPIQKKEVKNVMQAFGVVDGAARAARQAENFETQKEFAEAIKMHQQAADLYGQAATNIKLANVNERADGHQKSKSELASDK